MKYKITYTAQFKKSLKIAHKQHRDINKLNMVIEMLAQKQPLPIWFKDHKLSGNMSNLRACHIDPDWVLIYCYIDEELIVIMHNLGPHNLVYKNKY